MNDNRNNDAPPVLARRMKMLEPTARDRIERETRELRALERKLVGKSAAELERMAVENDEAARVYLLEAGKVGANGSVSSLLWLAGRHAFRVNVCRARARELRA